MFQSYSQAGGESRRTKIDFAMIESKIMTVKLILRDREYEVKPGMTLLDSLKKISILSESVIATRDGEMILDDEILKDGDEVKLIAVISGGSCHTCTCARCKCCEGDSPKQSPCLRGDCFVATSAPRNDTFYLILSRFSLNHSIVRRIPSSKETCALQPKYSFARLTSSPRRG